MSDQPLLAIDGLKVSYHIRSGLVSAVDGADLTVHRGEVVALVGESGSGKSSLAHAVVGLLPANGRIDAGTIRLAGQELTGLSERRLRAVRGAQVGLVPQDPTVSLNPVKRVGEQVAEVLRLHGLADRRRAALDAVDLLDAAGLPQPATRARQYPHELSGGMRQRVLIAIAIAGRPKLIVADEPTSSLDVTVQRAILDHLESMTRRLGTALLLVTHDLAVAADRAGRIAVMSGGRVVEVGPAAALLHHPATADTRRLLASAPSLAPRPVWLGASGAARRPGPVGHSGTATAAPRREPPGLGAPPLVSASGLVKEYPLPGVGTGPRSVRAVDGVDLSIDRGQTLALVGESGSGKSTTGRLILRLTTPTAGRILFAGADVTHTSGAALRALRRRAQMIYQNPYASLDPRFSVAEIITEPLRAFRDGDRNSRRKRARELLDRVALPASTLHRRPAELSGGQRQRVAIARALALSPDLLVCDEPVSALDVSVQAQVLELLAQLQADDAVAYLFISHDLAVVRQIAHRVAVMRAGRVVEVGATADIFHHPTHPYTRELLAAIPGGRALPLAVERNPARPSNRHTCAGCSARSPPA